MKGKNNKSGGFLAGLILIIIGVMVLWSNEGRAVKTQKAIKEAKENYIQIKSNTVDSKNDGKLVSTYGKVDLSSSEELLDSRFNIHMKAIKLVRYVEMYQWVEDCETDEDNTENCTYSKEWSDKLIDSTEFSKSGYNNPSSFQIENENFVASNVKMGEFTLPSRLIEKISVDKTIGNEVLLNQYANSVSNYKVVDKYITNSLDSENPIVGDTRVSYKYASPDSVSVLAVQTDSTFEAYTAKSGNIVFEICKGEYTGNEILEKMAHSNKVMKWGLRALGFFLLYIGFAALFSPLQILSQKIPVIRNIVLFSSNVISTVLSISLSLLVIAIAWFRFRPILSISLIAVIVVLIVLLNLKKKDNIEEPKESLSKNIKEKNTDKKE